MRSAPLLAALSLGTAAASWACTSKEPLAPPPEQLAWVRLRLPPGTTASALRLTAEGSAPLRHRETAPDGSLLLAWGGAAEAPLRIRASGPGLCPLAIEARAGTWTEAEARPWLRTPMQLDRVGFGRPFEVRLEPGCREALRGEVRWRIVAGPSIPIRTEAHGLRVRGRMPTAEATGLLESTPSWGIVPVTPRTRAEVVLEGTWHGPGPSDGWRLHVRVAATDRASGVPSLAPTQQVWLAGSGWRVERRPRGARAAVEPPDELPWHRFEPDRTGTWQLRDGSGRLLAIRVGRFDETRLDCGRAGCHREATRGAAHSPMTASWLRFVRDRLPEDGDPRCGLGCHAAGAPGHPDGGLHELSARHGWRLRGGEAGWTALPPLLRRAAGVGCQGCHGPGAIPSPHERWAILRAEVCGGCHDAPPRYGHLLAWRQSRMARADAHTGASGPACRGCHTTDGFLERLHVSNVHPPPPEARPLGIGCAACHAPHADPEPGPHLLRSPPIPAALETAMEHASAAERLCAGCHGGLADGAGSDPLGSPPAASRAIRLDGEPHGTVKGGCTGCHRGGPPDLERGRAHAFAPDRSACRSCHRNETERVSDFETEWKRRYTELLERARSLGWIPPGRPARWHADARRPRSERKARSRRPPGELLDFLADSALWVHAPREARRRLDALERALASTASAP